MATALTALDELKLLRLKTAHPEHPAVSTGVLRGVFDLAFRALAAQDAEIAKLRALHGEAANLLSEASAEIARLQAELDAASDVPVEYVVEAGLAAAMAADPHRDDGALLRCTDGERKAWAWKAATRIWEPVT